LPHPTPAVRTRARTSSSATAEEPAAGCMPSGNCAIMNTCALYACCSPSWP
jgi:hypothetical protein